MKTNKPILITGVPRSGATFIAKIMAICGAEVGGVNVMFEHESLTLQNKLLLNSLKIPLTTDLNTKSHTFNVFSTNIKDIVQNSFIHSLKWLYKSSTLSLTWKYWNKIYPDAQWVIVRRKPSSIINSCTKTAYMDMMKNKKTLKKIGVDTEEQGWKWLIHQYEKQWLEMYKAGLNIMEVYPDRMENQDYHKIGTLLNWVNLEWKDEVEEMMSPYFIKEEK